MSSGLGIKNLRVLRLIFLVITSIILVETLIMGRLHHLGGGGLSDIQVGLIDSAVLTILIMPSFYLFFYRPITEEVDRRERAEEELRRSYHELEKKVEERTWELSRHAAELEKANEMKGLFTDILGHDILNPAGVINGAVELMLLEEPDKRELEMIRKNIQRIIELTENASTFSRLQNMGRVGKTSMNLKEVIQKSVDAVDPGKLKVENRIEDEVTILANPIIESLFTNIIQNGVKYASTGGRLIIEGRKRNGFYEVDVKDFGPGIPDRYKEEVFERFRRREKGGVKGSGLGLAIAKRIAELHDGRIWIVDNPRGGSIFKVALPLIK